MLLEPAAQRFLDTKDVAILATIQPDGSPLAMPMWFLHDPDALLGWIGIGSSRAGSIQAASQISWWSGWGSGSTGRAWKHKANCW